MGGEVSREPAGRGLERSRHALHFRCRPTLQPPHAACDIPAPNWEGVARLMAAKRPATLSALQIWPWKVSLCPQGIHVKMSREEGGGEDHSRLAAIGRCDALVRRSQSNDARPQVSFAPCRCAEHLQVTPIETQESQTVLFFGVECRKEVSFGCTRAGCYRPYCRVNETSSQCLRKDHPASDAAIIQRSTALTFSSRHRKRLTISRVAIAK